MPEIRSLAICLFLLFFHLYGKCQSSIPLPEDLAASRSVVIVSASPQNQNGISLRGNWEAVAKQVHHAFKKIGIDGVYYLNEGDFNGGEEISHYYQALLTTRQIKNLIFIDETGSGYQKNYELKILPFDSYVAVQTKNIPGYWMGNSNLDELLLQLGRTVLRQKLDRKNFLIADDPEFLQDIGLYNGLRFENFPGRLRSLKLAVIMYSIIPINEEWSEEVRSMISSQNKENELANEKLGQLMSNYPFPYELVPYAATSDLYKLGYQYVLLSVSSTGKTIREILDYSLKKGETNYISATARESGLSLATYPARAELTKFYIKQTISNDLHVGPRWDAAPDWEIALENFIINLKEEVK